MHSSDFCPRCERDVFLYQTVNGTLRERCFLCGYNADVGTVDDTGLSLIEGGLGQAEEGILTENRTEEVHK